jgi:hypothetical protein
MIDFIKNKLTLIAAIIFAAMVLCIGYLSVKNKHLKFDYDLALNNYKAYEQMYTAKLDSVNGKNYELKMTKEMLERSQDTIIRDLNELRKNLKIKDKQLKQLQYLSTVTKIHDSVYFTDTLFRHDINLDTVISDDWHTLNIRLSYPSTIKVDSRFRNELSVIVSTEKQTINPPSKIFFIRWFQKKQELVKIDVIDKNPYAEVTEQRFVEVVKEK